MFAEAMLSGMLLLPYEGPELDPPSSWATTLQMACLSELERTILIEATIPKESPLGQRMVGYVASQRTEDGRWGKTVCATVDMKYRSVKKQSVLVKIKRKGRALWKRVVKLAQSFTCDFSFKCMKRFDKVKGSEEQQAEARRAALEVLSGDFVPPPHLKDALYYMYPAKSGKGSISWFDCITEPLGTADHKSVHVFYKDADEATLAKRYEEKPACRAAIDHARIAMKAKRQKPPPTESPESLGL